MSARIINYHGDEKVYNKEKADAILQEAVDILNTKDEELDARIDTKQDQLTFDELPEPGSTNPVTSKGIYEAIAASADMPIGETMFWPVSECVDRAVVSDNPLEFDVHDKHYSIEVPDTVVKLNISKDIPANWHALDGTAELLAADYPELAAFMPDNVTTEGKIWLPYVHQKIIKIR